MSLTDDKRVQFESNWANFTAKHSLPREQRNLWHTYQYTARTFVAECKQHVVWQLTEDGCEVIDIVQLAEVSMEMHKGITLTLRSKNHNEFEITSTPRIFPGVDVFFWVPAINEVRFAPHDWNKAGDIRDLRVAMNFKQRYPLAGGANFEAHYVNELRDFKRLHPNAVI